MKNSLLRNDLLYIGEHLTCNHYMADIGTGWLYREIDADEQIMYQSLQNNHLVFFMEGNCVLSCNQFVNRTFQAGEMILLPRMASISGKASTPLKFVDMAFAAPMSGCDKLILQNLYELNYASS